MGSTRGRHGGRWAFCTEAAPMRRCKIPSQPPAIIVFYPACMSGCPVGAYEKDADTGIVKHLDDQCIGCQYCTFTCPYEVPQYSPKRGIVENATCAATVLRQGRRPRACRPVQMVPFPSRSSRNARPSRTRRPMRFCRGTIVRHHDPDDRLSKARGISAQHASRKLLQRRAVVSPLAARVHARVHPAFSRGVRGPRRRWPVHRGRRKRTHSLVCGSIGVPPCARGERISSRASALRLPRAHRPAHIVDEVRLLACLRHWP